VKLDLLNISRPTLEVRISEDTELEIYPASKRLVDRLVNAEETLKTNDDLYEICAELMSHNKGNIQISKNDIEHLDIYAIRTFLDEYGAFLREVKKDPN